MKESRFTEQQIASRCGLGCGGGRTGRPAVGRGQCVAESLEFGVAGQNGILQKKGQRLERPDSVVLLRGCSHNNMECSA